MAKGLGKGPAGALLAVIGIVAVAQSGFPFSGFWKATRDATGTAAGPRREAPARAAVGPALARYACGGNLIRAPGGGKAIEVSCAGLAITGSSPGPGVIVLRLGRRVTGCAASVTARLGGLPGGVAPGEIMADVGTGRAPDQVTVRTFGHDGKPAVRGFSLALRCRPAADHGVIVIRAPDRTGTADAGCPARRSWRVLVTRQGSAGARIRSVALGPGCQVRIRLRAAPAPGHPVRVGWALIPA